MRTLRSQRSSSMDGACRAERGEMMGLEIYKFFVWTKYENTRGLGLIIWNFYTSVPYIFKN